MRECVYWPGSSVVDRMGDKVNARRLMAQQGMPTGGQRPNPDVDSAREAAQALVFPWW